MSVPTLPQNDRHKKKRAAQLETQRDVWRINKDWHGLVFPDPDSELRNEEVRWFGRVILRRWGLPDMVDTIIGVGLSETLKIAWHGVQTKWNAFRTRVAHASDGPHQRLITRVHRILGRVNDRITTRIWHPEAFDETPPPWTQRQALTEEEINQTLPTLPPPPSRQLWNSDEFFAWQRVAGTSPFSITAVAPNQFGAVQKKLPLTAARYAGAMPNDTLASADADGRLFVVDLEVLEGLETAPSYGWRRWLTAPVAVFALTPDRATLMPVAIQCGQDPATTTYFTPEDGEHWRWAKIHFQVADSNYHGVVEHLTLCHMLVGGMAVSLRRQLAPNHPLRVLLEPHIEGTIGVVIATKALLEPGGLTPELQSVSLESAIELSNRAWASFDWNERSSENEFARRGVADPAVLPNYPARDDAEKVTGALRTFVQRYVRLYYQDDRTVQQDTELVAWLSEVQSTEGENALGLTSVPTPTTVDELAAFITNFIWRISPYHAVINYTVYDAMGFVANMPTAAYAPPPDPNREYGPKDWLWLLPPQVAIDAQIQDVWNVSNVRMNTLGHYGDHFSDPAVKPLIADFQSGLQTAEAEIGRANALRYVAFTELLPSRLTNSIHI